MDNKKKDLPEGQLYYFAQELSDPEFESSVLQNLYEIMLDQEKENSSLVKGKVYIGSRRAPPGVDIRTGSRGGRFYLTGQTQPVSGEVNQPGSNEIPKYVPKVRSSRYNPDARSASYESDAYGNGINLTKNFFSDSKAFDIMSEGFVVDNPEYFTSIDDIVLDKDGELGISLSIQTQNKKIVGVATRFFNWIDPDTLSVRHELLRLYPGFTRLGLGTELLENSEEMYRKFGIPEITMKANLSIGGYAWASRGFDFTPEGRDEALDYILMRFFAGDVELPGRYGEQGLTEHQIKRRQQITKMPLKQKEKLWDDINNLEHSWDIASFNPFNEKHGEHLGKDLLLGSHWNGIKNLNPKSASMQAASSHKTSKTLGIS